MNELDSDEKIRVDDMSRLSCISKRRGLLSMRLQSTVVWHSVYSGTPFPRCLPDFTVYIFNFLIALTFLILKVMRSDFPYFFIAI